MRIEIAPEEVVSRTEAGREGLPGLGGRRRRLVGKEPVWMEEWWRRR